MSPWTVVGILAGVGVGGVVLYKVLSPAAPAKTAPVQGSSGAGSVLTTIAHDAPGIITALAGFFGGSGSGSSASSGVATSTSTVAGTPLTGYSQGAGLGDFTLPPLSVGL